MRLTDVSVTLGEAHTVNHELKLKVEEAAQVNSDLRNLIASTDIATIFVDRNMLIKRFTPQASKLFNIIEADIGRSLLDITHRLQYDRLAEDATETFESLQSTEQEIASIDGRWYLARFLPYRTTEDHIDGAVLTFIDITSRRQAEIRARAVEELTRLVVESAIDYAILTLDSNGYITSWNKGAERRRDLYRLAAGVFRSIAGAARLDRRQGNGAGGKKILLIDDATQASQGLVDLLSLESIDVIVTKSPAEALQLVQIKDIDLILSDISMPEMDGYQFLTELRKLSHTATLPVIAMTSYTRPKEVRKIMQAGFDAWVAKPLVIEKLFEAVMNVLKVKHTIE